MVFSSILYLDTCADSGWPKPFGKSKTQWYIVAGLALTPEYDYAAQTAVDKILTKYITESERKKFQLNVMRSTIMT
jgi:hypothetical protein